MPQMDKDRVDRLFERRPGSRALALALGRAVIVWLVGTLVVVVGGLLVEVSSTAYLLPVAVAIVYGYLGYRKQKRLDAT